MQALSSALPAQAMQQDITAQTQTLQQRLAHLQQSGEQGERLHEELAEFASLLIYQMLSSMRKTVPKSGLLDGGFAHDLYFSLFDQEVSRHIAQRGSLGLTAILAKQFGIEHQNEIEPARLHQTAREAYGKQSTTQFSLPLQGHLSSPFGPRQDPFDEQERRHDGIDISASPGALVRAAAPGQVTFSGTQPGYGNLVIITHPDGYQTYYAHNAENLVEVGAHVEKRQPIAQVGQTGRATGPHLHFEIRKDGQAIDPMALLGSPLTALKKG